MGVGYEWVQVLDGEVMRVEGVYVVGSVGLRIEGGQVLDTTGK